MRAFNELLSKYLVDIDKSINKGVVGINYLESIKYLLIEKLENIDQNIFIDFHTNLNTKNQSLANVLDILEKNNFWYRITPEYELKGSQQKYASQTYLSYGIVARNLGGQVS